MTLTNDSSFDIRQLEQYLKSYSGVCTSLDSKKLIDYWKVNKYIKCLTLNPYGYMQITPLGLEIIKGVQGISQKKSSPWYAKIGNFLNATHHIWIIIIMFAGLIIDIIN